MLYSLGVALGLVALIVPGVWLSVRWYFAAQAAVVDGLGPADALRRSAEVVETRWWRTFGVLLAFGLLVGIFGAVAGAVIRHRSTTARSTRRPGPAPGRGCCR